MTDLRDHAADFDAAARRLLDRIPHPSGLRLVWAVPATCHRNRPVDARGLCRPCYQTAWNNGTVRDLPLLRSQRTRADFVADYELLRSEGHTRRQIADRLGMTYSAVCAAYSRAVRAGDLNPDRRPT